MRRLCIILCILTIAVVGSSAQKLVRGIVVDSLTLEYMPGVYIQIKHTNRGTVTDKNGIFTAMLKPTDTLVFSFIGYKKSEALATTDDEIMFIKMRDESVMLEEVVVRDRSFRNMKYIESPTLSTTKPLPAAGINLAYFSKYEKEKRKLVEVIRELNQVKVYVAVVNDASVRAEIIEKTGLSEARYYELLAIFNQKNEELMHSSDADLILEELFLYFEQYSQKR